MRQSAAVLLFAFCLSSAAVPALAGNQTAACLTSLNQNSHDPVVRDVHLRLQSGAPSVSYSACLISNIQMPWRYLALTFTVFDENGSALNAGGQRYEYVLPTYGAPENGPALQLTFSVDIPIDPKYGKTFLDKTVVILQSQPCTKPMPDCSESAAETETFLLPVTIDP